MTELERWYRLLIVAYPRWYRVSYEEELIATLLDASSPRSRPTLRTMLSLIGHGVGYRARAVPDGVSAARQVGLVGFGVAVGAAVMTVGVAGLAGSGHAAGSVLGVVLWCVIGGGLLVALTTAGWKRGAASAVVIVANCWVVYGGAELAGVYRPFGLAVAVAGLVALVAPPPTRRQVFLTGGVAVVVALTTARWLATRIDRDFARWDMSLDDVWSGSPWMYTDLGARVPAAAFLVLAAAAFAVGWFRRRVALVAAMLAVPLAVVGELARQGIDINASSGLRADALAVAAIAGVIVAAALSLVAHRHRQPSLAT